MSSVDLMYAVLAVVCIYGYALGIAFTSGFVDAQYPSQDNAMTTAMCLGWPIWWAFVVLSVPIKAVHSLGVYFHRVLTAWRSEGD